MNSKRFDVTQFISSLERQGANLDEELKTALTSGDSFEPTDVLERLRGRLPLSVKAVHRAYADGLGLPFVDMDWIHPDNELMALLPMDEWRRFHAFPLTKISGTIEVAMADPHDAGLSMLLEQQHGLWVSRMYSMPDQIDRYLNMEMVDALSVQEQISALTPGQISRITEQVNRGETEGILDLSEQIILLAQKRRASDIHLEPLDKETRLRLRIEGELKEILVLNPRIAAAVTGYFKIRSELDIAEKRLPQDGRMHAVIGGAPLDMRVSSIPTVHGEKLCIRLLDGDQEHLNLDAMHLASSLMPQYRQIIESPHGFFAVCGPTGSGKTTTLYATLSELTKPTTNITTIENPVEYRMGGINQIQAHPKIGLDFARCLRAILRQDPDIILVGEIRDKETAGIALQAALTGHLVLSTIHTNTAPEAVTRLIDMGVPAFLVAQAMLGALGQRLVRRLCTSCRRPIPITDELRHSLDIQGDIDGWSFFEATGCPECNGTGRKGRIPVHELLVLNDKARSQIANEQALPSWLTSIDHYRPMAADAICKALSGLIPVEEIHRVHYRHS